MASLKKRKGHMEVLLEIVVVKELSHGIAEAVILQKKNAEGEEGQGG